MSLKSIRENYKEHGLKYFTPQRAKLVIRSFIRKFTGLRIKEKDAIVFSEIVTYKSLTCPDCVQLGHCKVCKCPINELFSAMDVGCSDNKFPAFEEKVNWTRIWEHLKKGNVKLALKEYKKKNIGRKVGNNLKKRITYFFKNFTDNAKDKII
jgi:hypothetical protein